VFFWRFLRPARVYTSGKTPSGNFFFPSRGLLGSFLLSILPLSQKGGPFFFFLALANCFPNLLEKRGGGFLAIGKRFLSPKGFFSRLLLSKMKKIFTGKCFFPRAPPTDDHGSFGRFVFFPGDPFSLFFLVAGALLFFFFLLPWSSIVFV